jgi:hypothetical protein
MASEPSHIAAATRAHSAHHPEARQRPWYHAGCFRADHGHLDPRVGGVETRRQPPGIAGITKQLVGLYASYPDRTS